MNYPPKVVYSDEEFIRNEGYTVPQEVSQTASGDEYIKNEPFEEPVTGSLTLSQPEHQPVLFPNRP